MTSRSDELMNQTEQDRRVDYVEFLTSDIEEIKSFYSEVFGWEFTDYGPEYTSFTDGRLGGGFASSVIGNDTSSLLWSNSYIRQTTLDGTGRNFLFPLVVIT